MAGKPCVIVLANFTHATLGRARRNSEIDSSGGGIVA
jgi:hypothetical protein